MPNNPHRKKAYDEIRKVMIEGIEAYYRRHPERAHDDRSKEAIVCSTAGLEYIFRVLDEYDLTPKSGVASGPEPQVPG